MNRMVEVGVISEDVRGMTLNDIGDGVICTITRSRLVGEEIKVDRVSGLLLIPEIKLDAFPRGHREPTGAWTFKGAIRFEGSEDFLEVTGEFYPTATTFNPKYGYPEATGYGCYRIFG